MTSKRPSGRACSGSRGSDSFGSSARASRAFVFSGAASHRPRRLARPRTPAFHVGNTGSNPVGDANEIRNGERHARWSNLHPPIATRRGRCRDTSCMADDARSTDNAKGYLPSWSVFDSGAISASIVVATAMRFWHLGRPAEPVYDETKVLTQAQAFLHGWRPPYSSHPPLGKLIVALSVTLFGNDPWGWRAANAILGSALVPITYLLARRLFRSRLAASIAAVLLL